MSDDPKWYQKLSKEEQERIDQTAHFFMGFFLSAAASPVAAWWLFHVREFIWQAPVERVNDTEKDMRFGLYGATVGLIPFLTWTGVVLTRCLKKFA